jgi:hypothetical protein
MEEGAMRYFWNMRLWTAVALQLSVGGCAGVVFHQEDDGRTKEVFVGTTFSVSLPPPSEDRRPELKGTIIRFLGRHEDGSSKGDVFEFKAVGLGEDHIRIPSSSGRDYVLCVKVKSASDEPTVLMHQH